MENNDNICSSIETYTFLRLNVYTLNETGRQRIYLKIKCVEILFTYDHCISIMFVHFKLQI